MDMSSTPIEPSSATKTPLMAAQIPLARHPDDAAMIRAAAELTRDLNVARPEIYWPDFLICTLLGYATMALAMMADTPLALLGWGLASVLTLYRAAQATDAEVTAFYVPGGWYGFAQLGEFLEKHSGHDLIVIDEYA